MKGNAECQANIMSIYARTAHDVDLPDRPPILAFVTLVESNEMRLPRRGFESG